MNYFLNKEENKTKAVLHTNEMDKKYKHQIKLSVEHSVIYTGGEFADQWLPEEHKYDTKISFLGMDTVSALAAIYDEEVINNIGLLNFASYKSPGGMFFEGSMAQEEALCHESFLYNVLRKFPGYYETNQKRLNKAMFTDRAIFTPDIIFRDKYECNVLTCAAPNYSAGLRYKNVSKEENSKALRDRTRFMLNCFAAAKCNIIILGAWGCGVFKQDPAEVAALFKEFLEGDFKSVFEQVVIAVPEDKKNYPAFCREFAG